MPYGCLFDEEIIDRGGEGIILRDPKSKYECGRSHSMLTVKVLHALLLMPSVASIS